MTGKSMPRKKVEILLGMYCTPILYCLRFFWNSLKPRWYKKSGCEQQSFTLYYAMHVILILIVWCNVNPSRHYDSKFLINYSFRCPPSYFLTTPHLSIPYLYYSQEYLVTLSRTWSHCTAHMFTNSAHTFPLVLSSFYLKYDWNIFHEDTEGEVSFQINEYKANLKELDDKIDSYWKLAELLAYVL